MKIKNPIVQYIEQHANIISYIQAYFPEYQPDGTVVCPFHEDSNPSLHINPRGQAYCHGCGERAGDIVELIAKLTGKEYEETISWMYEDINKDIVKKALVKRYEELLWENVPAIDYLQNKRNLDLKTIEKFQLGYEPASKRIIIPIFDQFGYCVNLRRMNWRRKEDKRAKVLNLKGHGRIRLFPENLVALEKRLILVEGEYDCLVGRRFGLPTVTWTGGAGNWNHDYDCFFKDKYVAVLYDNDRVGRKCGAQALEELKWIASFAVQLPVPQSTGKDLTDWSFSNPTLLKVWRNYNKGLLSHVPASTDTPNRTM